MKKMNKKGFTIVELVIVIAVIAILAGVLIPTFSGVVSKANQSSALQKATSTMKYTLAMSDYGTLADGTYFVVDGMGSDGYQFKYSNNSIEAVADALMPNGITFIEPTSNSPADASCKNAIIINTDVAKSSDFSSTTVGKIIADAVGDGTLAANQDINTKTKYAYTYTVGSGASATVWHVYTNSDYATDVVTFTYSK